MDFLLIPGAGGRAAWLWRLVAETLAAHGHRGVPVEVPSGDDDAGLTAYVDAAIDAAEGLGPVTVVAQSMGGLTAPLLAERLDVREIVLLNAMIPAPGETGGDWWANTGHEDAIVEPEEGADFDEQFFFHDVPRHLVQEALDGPEFQQSERPFDDPCPLAAWPDVPTRVVAGADDRFFPVAFQRRVARERLGCDIHEVPGGHLLALSRPAAFVAELLR